MRGALSILRRDLGRVRWTLFLFLLMLIGEVAVFCSPLASKPQTESQWSMVVMLAALTSWLVQFLLVTQLIHGDSPARIGAQWRSRPFRPTHLALGKIGGILLAVFLPPWLAAQAARLAFGLRPGVGDYEGPLYHLALLSGFTLVAVVTTTTARAFLTALGLLVGFGFAGALSLPLLGRSLASVEQPLIPTDVALSLALVSLAVGSVVSGYRKGGLPWGFLGIAWLCCLWFVLNGGPTPRQQPEAADASERFRVDVTWGSGWWGDDQPGWYGTLRHVRTKPRRVVAETPSYLGHRGGSFESWWPAIVPADAPARIDGLGDVEIVSSPDLFGRARPVGPLNEARLDSTHVGAGFADVFYTVRTYDLLGRLRFDETPSKSGPTWSMRSLENPRRVEMRTIEAARGATFDAATKRLNVTHAATGFLEVLWPIGAGVRVTWILNDARSECVLLRETIVGKGIVSYEYLPMDVPPDRRGRQDAK